nr:YdcH family protein [uncultured Roseococcus sp.]
MHAPRVRALESRHAELETRISAEGARPRPNDVALTRLKLEKLQLKEEMEKLRRAS